jgi:hypothetical protein
MPRASAAHVKSHTTVATGSTQTAVGGYLDQLLAANPTGNIAQILAEIQNLAPSQFRTAFESLHPGVYWANTDTTFAITRQYNRTLQQRLEGLRSLQRAEAAPQVVLLCIHSAFFCLDQWFILVPDQTMEPVLKNC